MTLVHTPEQQVLAPGERTLEELAVAANDSHQAVLDNVTTAIQYAISAGESLNAAFDLVPYGKWPQWVEQNLSISLDTASRYRRLARYKHVLEGRNFDSVAQGIMYLRTIEAPGVTRGKPRQIDRAEARRLKDSGMSYNEIAKVMGFSWQGVYAALIPESKRSKFLAAEREKRKRERAALRRERDRAIVLATKDDLGEAFSLLRRGLLRAQTALEASPSKQQRKEISAAISRMHEAEDLLVKASKQRDIA